jgi:DNA-binding transcriptional LysR family regulator
VRPTIHGERLIEYAEVVLNLVDEARDELDEMRGAQRGRLRIGGIATTMRTLLPQAARLFLAEHPSINLTLNEELSPALQAQLLNGTIDLALMSRPRDFPDEELEYRDLLAMPITIVADRNHPLAAHDRLTLADLTGWLWILPARPDPDRIALDAMFAAAELPLPQAVCEATSATFQMSMQAGSQWLSYLSQTSIFVRGAQSQFVALKLDRPAWTRHIGVACRRRRVNRPLITSFIRQLEQVCRTQDGQPAPPPDR